MSLETEQTLIEQYLMDSWVIGSSPRTKIQWEDIDVKPGDGESWLQVNILNGEEAQRSVGAPGTNIVRGVGVLAVRVNVPPGQGSKPFRALADILMGLFRNRELENIRFMVPYVSGGFRTVGQYSVWTIMCPFTRDEFNG